MVKWGGGIEVIVPKWRQMICGHSLAFRPGRLIIWYWGVCDGQQSLRWYHHGADAAGAPWFMEIGEELWVGFRVNFHRTLHAAAAWWPAERGICSPPLPSPFQQHLRTDVWGVWISMILIELHNPELSLWDLAKAFNQSNLEYYSGTIVGSTL